MDPRTSGREGASPTRRSRWKQLPAKVDIAIVVAGTASLISCARTMAPARLPLVGVNLGPPGLPHRHPGRPHRPASSRSSTGNYSSENPHAARRHVMRGGKKFYSTVAMNDIVVSRGAAGSMIEFSVNVDGEFIYTLRGDGLIVATPTGSTAYALSAGGPILHPALAALALVPINPHTLSNRPVAIRSESRVEIMLIRGEDARANFDVQSHKSLELGDIVAVAGAPKPATLLHPPNYRYFSMLRNKLHWNERNS
jgi:NAD+ kinase